MYWLKNFTDGALHCSSWPPHEPHWMQLETAKQLIAIEPPKSVGCWTSMNIKDVANMPTHKHQTHDIHMSTLCFSRAGWHDSPSPTLECAGGTVLTASSRPCCPARRTSLHMIVIIILWLYNKAIFWVPTIWPLWPHDDGRQHEFDLAQGSESSERCKTGRLWC